MKTISFAFSFKPLLLRCLIYLVLEGNRKSTRVILAMGVKIGGDSDKSGKNTDLLVVINVRLLQKIALLNLTNRNLFKK